MRRRLHRPAAPRGRLPFLLRGLRRGGGLRSHAGNQRGVQLVPYGLPALGVSPNPAAHSILTSLKERARRRERDWIRPFWCRESVSGTQSTPCLRPFLAYRWCRRLFLFFSPAMKRKMGYRSRQGDLACGPSSEGPCHACSRQTCLPGYATVVLVAWPPPATHHGSARAKDGEKRLR